MSEDSKGGRSHSSELSPLIDLSLPDYSVKTIGSDAGRLTELNEFFNSSQIKSELHWFTHRDTLERAAEREDRRLYYIRPHDAIHAGLMVWCESRVLEPHQAQIRLVAVHPDYRNHGLGRYLVDCAVEFATEYGKKEMIADVAVDSPAKHFWQACGFSQFDKYETRGGRQMLRMQRPISIDD